MLAIYVDIIAAGVDFIPDRLLGCLQAGCFHRMFLKTDLFYDQSIGFFHDMAPFVRYIILNAPYKPESDGAEPPIRAIVVR